MTVPERDPAGTPSDFVELLVAAKDGSPEAVGKLVAGFRPYLLLLANDELDKNLRGKLGPSDVVQETMMAAQRGVEAFRGSTREEWIAWLRTILRRELHRTRRTYQVTAKRKITKERPLDADSRVQSPPAEPADDQYTPGSDAMIREESLRLDEALANLPEDYRQVMQLRNWEQLSFEEIGSRMGRTAEATRKLWSRALIKLREELYGGDSGPTPR